MPWYKIVSRTTDEEDSVYYCIQLVGDGESIGPDIYAQVKAPNKSRAIDSLKTAIHELRGWDVPGIRIAAGDERIRSLSVVTSGTGIPYVDVFQTDGEASYLFMIAADGKKSGPTIDAIVRSDDPTEALAILVSELGSYPECSDGSVVLSIELEGEERIRLNVVLDLKSLRPWIDPASSQEPNG